MNMHCQYLVVVLSHTFGCRSINAFPTSVIRCILAEADLPFIDDKNEKKSYTKAFLLSKPTTSNRQAVNKRK